MKLIESIHQFASVTLLEARIARRGIAFRAFAVAATALVFYVQLTYQLGLFTIPSGSMWQFTALPAFVPFMNAFVFSALQTVLVALLVTGVVLKDRERGTREVLRARPAGNFSYNAGKIAGVALALLQLDAVVIALAILFHLFIAPGPFDAWLYLFYLLTLTLPTLLFSAGLTAALAALTRSRAATLLLALPALGGLYLLRGVDALDLHAVTAEAIPSPVAGLPDAAAYLLQRGAFLLAGVGLILLASAGGRLPGSRRERALIPCAGCALLLAAAVAVFAREAGAAGDRATREAYRQAAARYHERPPVTLARASIRVALDGQRLRGETLLVLVNEGREAIDTILLHLNPSLAVESVEREGHPLPYRRDRQVLLVGAPVGAGDSTTITVRHAGGIDEHVARLDVSERDRRASEGPFFNPGKRLAFLRGDFALLIPDALWYPSPPVADPPARARFRLEAKVPAGLVAASQGERREGEDGSVTFHPGRPVTGVTLVAGPFARASAEMPGGQPIDAYYFKGNHLVRKYLHAMTVKDTRENISRLFALSPDTIDYPFPRLAIVEVPSSLALFRRHDEEREDCIQPALLLWPEEGASSIHGRFTSPPPAEDLTMSFKLLPWTWSRYASSWQTGIEDLRALFAGNGYTIHPGRFPALDLAWRATIYRARAFPASRARVDGELSRLLATRSLGEAYRDPSIPPATRLALARVKGELLFRYLLLNASYRDLYRLDRELERRFPARPVDPDTLFAALRGLTGEDPLPFIEEWHDGVGGLPEFAIRDAMTETFPAGEERQHRARFKIHNRGAAAGIITVTCNSDAKNGEAFLLPPGACKEISVARNRSIHEIDVDLGLSANFPDNASFSFRGPRPDSGDPSPAGARDIDPATFPASPPAGTIVVDDGDEGFRVIETLPWIQRRLARGEGPVSRYLADRGPRHHRWTSHREEGAFGDALKGYHGRESGDGKSRVEWTANLPDGGTYDLHVFAGHHPPPLGYSLQPEATFHYTVSTPGEEPVEIPLQLHLPMTWWVHLGRFRVAPGACTVALDDRVTFPPGQREYIPPFYLYADAIRWTRVDVP